ncbi:hypothetical protein CCUS01_09197 [Colletotrichum cuscutae]|uniref:Uncharacterized protein n=1 Tax=Colletotrichum cuscutae TaxID=1209917 RepID=A0AAI9UKE0_9PEZI|nr:hypothetical protein CCUS01_09197 [Colletotrichum cuscutae]
MDRLITRQPEPSLLVLHIKPPLFFGSKMSPEAFCYREDAVGAPGHRGVRSAP